MKDKITKRSSIRFSIIERINYYFSDPLKKHNNSIESVKETEKQSKETAPLFDFLSLHKGDNSPPISTEFEHSKDGIHFRGRCCGLCCIQVKKESNEKTVALFLFH